MHHWNIGNHPANNRRIPDVPGTSDSGRIQNDVPRTSWGRQYNYFRWSILVSFWRHLMTSSRRPQVVVLLCLKSCVGPIFRLHVFAFIQESMIPLTTKWRKSQLELLLPFLVHRAPILIVLAPTILSVGRNWSMTLLSGSKSELRSSWYGLAGVDYFKRKVFVSSFIFVVRRSPEENKSQSPVF